MFSTAPHVRPAFGVGVAEGAKLGPSTRLLVLTQKTAEPVVSFELDRPARKLQPPCGPIQNHARCSHPRALPATAGATEVCVTDEEQLVGIMEAGLAQRAVKGGTSSLAHGMHGYVGVAAHLQAHKQVVVGRGTT